MFEGPSFLDGPPCMDRGLCEQPLVSEMRSGRYSSVLIDELVSVDVKDFVLIDHGKQFLSLFIIH